MDTDNHSLGFPNETDENILIEGTTVKDDQAAYIALFQGTQSLIRNIFAYMQFSTGILIIVANLMILVCFKRFHFLRRKPNIYIFSLSISDLMAGFGTMIVSCLNGFIQDHNVRTTDLCVFGAVFLYFALVTSLFSMLCAACERYIHIVHPFLHARHEDSMIHLAIVGIGWFILLVCTIILGYPNIAQPGVYCYLANVSHPMTFLIITMLTSVPQLLAIITVMLLILRVKYKHSRQIAAIERLEMRVTQSNVVQCEGKDAVCHPSTSKVTDEQMENSVKSNSYGANPQVSYPKATKIPKSKTAVTSIALAMNPVGQSSVAIHQSTMSQASVNPVAELPAFKKVNRSRTNMVIILLIVALICWVPMILLLILRFALDYEYVITKEWAVYSELSVWMIALNSLLNPFLYQRFSPDIKKAYRILVQERQRDA